MKALTFEELDRLSIRTGCETETNRAADLELRRRGYVFNASEQQWIKPAPDPSVGTPQTTPRWFVERQHPNEHGFIQVRGFDDRQKALNLKAMWDRERPDLTTSMWEYPIQAAVGTPPSADDQTSMEQQARDIVSRMGFDDADQLTAGDVVELANLLAELTRLRAENEHWHSHYDAAQANWDEVLRERTALLIDLRALVEQWRQFAVDVESREECSAVMRCYNDLRARLSREPYQDDRAILPSKD